MRILVTGSGGFVGRHLCRYLRSIGDEVIECPGPEGLGALDVTDGEAVRQRIGEAQPASIVHLAGVSSVAWSHSNPAKTFLVNGLGTVNVLQAVRDVAPATRLLLIGSGEMYGRIPEGHSARENEKLCPVSPYGASKCAAEEMAQQYALSYGVETICVRPFNHIGAGQASHFVVPSLARQIVEGKRSEREPMVEVGDLSPVRDFLHVEDVVRGYRLLLEQGTGGEAYNLCSGKPRSIRSLLDELLEVAQVQIEIRVDPTRFRPAEIPWLVGDASRMRALGWQSRRTVREALTEVFNEALGR